MGFAMQPQMASYYKLSPPTAHLPAPFAPLMSNALPMDNMANAPLLTNAPMMSNTFAPAYNNAGLTFQGLQHGLPQDSSKQGIERFDDYGLFSEDSSKYGSLKHDPFNKDSFKHDFFNEDPFNEDSFNEDSFNQDFTNNQQVLSQQTSHQPSGPVANADHDDDDDEIQFLGIITKPPSAPAPANQNPQPAAQNPQHFLAQQQQQQQAPTHQRRPRRLEPIRHNLPRQSIPDQPPPPPPPPPTTTTTAPALFEPHPLTPPTINQVTLIAHPLPPTILPHLTTPTLSSLARLFLDFEYRDIATPNPHPHLPTHLSALNAARRTSGTLLTTEWQRRVRAKADWCRAAGAAWESEEDGDGAVPGGCERELRVLDKGAGRVLDGMGVGERGGIVVVGQRGAAGVQLRQVRGPSAREWEECVIDAVGEVWREGREREKKVAAVQEGDEGGQVEKATAAVQEEGGQVEGEEGAAVQEEVEKTVRFAEGVEIVGEEAFRLAARERAQREQQRGNDGGEVVGGGVQKKRGPNNAQNKPKPALKKTKQPAAKKKGKKAQAEKTTGETAAEPITIAEPLPDYPDAIGASGNCVSKPDKYSQIVARPAAASVWTPAPAPAPQPESRKRKAADDEDGKGEEQVDKRQKTGVVVEVEEEEGDGLDDLFNE